MTAFRPLPLGAIRPRGWLADQLALQATNITGRIEELWPDVGEDSGWLGGKGESWERGPYFADGLVPLAHITQDPHLLDRASVWVEAILGSQREDGQFGPRGNDDWWPRMVALKVLLSHHGATGDERVVEFVRRYLRFQLDELPQRPLEQWGAARGADNMLVVWWLYERQPEGWMLQLFDELDRQTFDWGRYLTTDLITGKATVFEHRTHGPNVAMGLKADSVRYLRSGDAEQLARSGRSLENLDRWHGQVHGFFSGDEWLAGREAQQGVETCQVVEGMFSLEIMLAITGDARYGDLLEGLAYNLLPASSDPLMRAHQYHQQANQASADVAQRPWSYSGDDANVFGFEPHFGCCTANLHQGWPKFVSSLWMQAGADITAMSLAPCEVTWQSPHGQVVLEVEGVYPFDDRVKVRVRCENAARFAVRVRVPSWATALHVDGEPTEAVDGYAAIEREWDAGESVIEVAFGAVPELVRRERQSVGVRWGALVMVLPLGENWTPVPGAPGLGEWVLSRRRSWNYGLITEGELGAASWVVRTHQVGSVPFALHAAPVTISVRLAKVPGWHGADAEMPPPPNSPVLNFLALERADLVPYGSARLRVAELPTLRWERADMI